MLYDECEGMLVPRPKREVERRVRGGMLGTACINEAALMARSAILSTLASWAGLVRDERPVRVSLQREVAALSRFLLIHLDWLATHPAARELSDELEEAVGMAERVVQPSVAQKLEVGKCEKHGCGSTLYATLRDENGRSPSLVSCDHGHVVGPREWLLLHHSTHVRGAVEALRTRRPEEAA
jgi:hypothetical protein